MIEKSVLEWTGGKALKRPKFKKGDKAVMINCMEGRFHNGQIWVCRTDSFLSASGDQVVFLEHFAGYFYCKYLKKVSEEDLLGAKVLEQASKTSFGSSKENALSLEESIILISRWDFDIKSENPTKAYRIFPAQLETIIEAAKTVQRAKDAEIIRLHWRHGLLEDKVCHEFRDDIIQQILNQKEA